MSPLAISRRLCAAVVLLGAVPPLLAEEPVRVVVDMDARALGMQSSVATWKDVVGPLSIYIYDPLDRRRLWGIGYIGGIDRGIGFGHMRSPQLQNGTVVALDGQVGAPANPGNFGLLEADGVIQEAFDGPEFQYLEYGATAPASLPSAPDQPVFSVNVRIEGRTPGDVYEFYVVDFVAIWSNANYGAFSVRSALSLDTGGDATPDLTRTLYGIDADTPLPAPPAAYQVDFIDGPRAGGGATIVIVPVGDFTGDGCVDQSDLGVLLADYGCDGPDCAGDIDGDGDADQSDLGLLLGHYGDGC